MNILGNPIVSVLVPVFNTRNYIEKCAISLFEQDFSDNSVEYIFINDSSTDDSVEILHGIINKYSRLKSQIRIINHPFNKGLATARNTAIENAAGKYILHVDSDDFLDVECLRLLIINAKENDSDIVFCDYYEYYSDEKCMLRKRYLKKKSYYLHQILSFSMSPSIWGTLIKKSLYIKNNIMAINGVNYGEDYSVITRLIYNANVVTKVEKPLYYYRLNNPHSYMNQKKIEIQIEQTILAYKVVFDYFQFQREYLYSLLVGAIRLNRTFFELNNENGNDLFDMFYKRSILFKIILGPKLFRDVLSKCHSLIYKRK